MIILLAILIWSFVTVLTISLCFSAQHGDLNQSALGQMLEPATRTDCQTPVDDPGKRGQVAANDARHAAA